MEVDDSKLIPMEDTSKVVPMEDVPLKKWERFLEDDSLIEKAIQLEETEIRLDELAEKYKTEQELQNLIEEQKRKELLEWQEARILEGIEAANRGELYSTEEVLDMLFGEEIGNL